MTFGQPEGFYSVCKHPAAASIGRMPQVRRPQLQEKVCVVVAASDGPYMSEQTVVRQLSMGGRAFFLDLTQGNLFSLCGGLVVSVADGAVLGVFCRDTTVPAMSVLSMCVTVPVAVEEPVDPVAVLEKALPMLHVSSWDRALVAEACRHSSMSWEGTCNKALALRGDARLRSLLYERLAEAGIPYSTWNAHSSTLQSNATMSKLAGELGLNSILSVQSGLALAPGHEAYATLLEALCCVMLLEEDSAVAMEALSVIGVVPSLEELSGDRPAGHMMRRPSELGIVIEDDGGVKLLTPVD